jgi:putative DNA-invertase from lambdoid prophage Rac
MRVAIYARVSTQDQNTDLQITELKAYAKARGWEDVQIYEEKVSGTSTKNRTQLAEVMSLAKARKIDVVLVWKLDRFARSLLDLVGMLNELTQLGVAFISIKDQIDMTTSAGRLMMQILGAFGEFEASMIKERVNAGLKAAKARGVRLGAKKSIDHGKVSELAAQGVTPVEIAKRLKCHKATVHKIIKNHVR